MPTTIRTISDIQSLLSAIQQSRYAGSRKLSDLLTVKTLIDQLEIAISETKPAFEHEKRTLRLLAKQCGIHKSAVNRRITNVERMNEYKSRRLRQERARLKLADILVDTGALTKIMHAQDIQAKRIYEARIEQIKHEAVAVPLLKEMKEQEQFTHELEEQGTDLVNILERYQKEKEAKPAPSNAVTEENVTNTDTKQDVVAYGKPEDWLS